MRLGFGASELNCCLAAAGCLLGMEESDLELGDETLWMHAHRLGGGSVFWISLVRIGFCIGVERSLVRRRRVVLSTYK